MGLIRWRSDNFFSWGGGWIAHKTLALVSSSLVAAVWLGMEWRKGGVDWRNANWRGHHINGTRRTRIFASLILYSRALGLSKGGGLLMMMEQLLSYYYITVSWQNTSHNP